MKKIYLVIAVIFIALSTNAQSVFYEDFENGLTQQFTHDYIVGALDWVTDPGAVTLGPAAGMFEGDSAAHFYFDGSSGDVSTLTTPSLDLSAGGYRLSFAHVQPDWVGDQNTLSIYYSGDNGTTWALIDSIVGDVPDYVEVEYILDDYAATTATSMIRFSGWIDYGYSIGLDAVNVFLPESDDAELTMATAPVDGCGLGNETVVLEVFNNGLDTIFSIDATYEVGIESETETFTVSIPSGQTGELTFSIPADLSSPGTYDFMAWVELTDDLNASNDTIWFSVESIPVISGLPYAEDFESGAGGWTSGGNLSTWELGLPTNTFIDTANSGINAWVTDLDGDYAVGEQSYVESPCFDFSSLTIDPVFRFAFITATEANWDGAWLEVSTDAGISWSTVGNFGEGTNWYNNEDEHGITTDEDWWDGTLGTSEEWLVATHLLDGVAGSGSVKIRVFFNSDVSTVDEGFAFDDIEIFEQPSINAGVTEILSPVNGCGLGVEQVTVIIENNGDSYLVDYNIEYDAGTGVVTQLITDTLYVSEIDTITFTVPVDLSIVGDYDFAAWTAVVGDGDAGNDTIFTTVSNIPVISGLPYAEDFETGAGGWTTGGVSSSWELGEPQGAFIDTANSGINAWVTNLSGEYPVSELSYIESPCFDFSSLSIDPIFEFAQIYNTESCCDEGYVDVSVDAGATWSRLGISGEGTNWYNDAFNNEWDGNSGDSTEWRIARHLLDGTAGESSVKIRIGFSSDGSINAEGFAVDDISLTEQPAINSEVMAVVSPVSSCGLTATESVQVQVANLGSSAMDSVIIGFNFDNGSSVTETFNNSIAVGGDSTFTLSQTIDLSVPGDYILTVWTATVGDGDMTNDTLSITVISVPTISSVPYNEDFESGSGGWVTNGVNSSWELGEPATAFIDTANSGINAWVTNLTGNYSISEVSYVESPCFDFSSITDDPIISFAGIFRTESCCDEGWVEVSLDGGTTYTKLGAAGEGENWYNDTFNNWWDGTSGADNVWVNAEHILDGAAGQSEVKVRFVFQSDGSINDDGFGLDDISIHPQPQLDLVAISFDGPTDGCSLDQETVAFSFWNKGLQTVSNFDVGFIVDGGTAQTETYTGSVASGDSASYTFTTEMANLAIAGPHAIDVFTALVGDENTSNDTLLANSVFNHGDNTPLSQTEEPGTLISATIAEGTSSSLFFCGLPENLNGCLGIQSVTLNSITHTFLSDLDIYLIAPSGDSIELCTDNGGSGANITNVVFSDASTNNITLQTTSIAPGMYHTEDVDGFAGLYNGQNPNGAWTLWIDDDAGGDDGVLVSWSMTFADNNPTPELAFSDTTICLSQTLMVTTTNIYDSYLWSTGNSGQPIELHGDVLGLGPHEISVLVDQNGCTGESNSFVLTVDACLGITELGNANIEIYPNPSNGEVILSIDGESDDLTFSVLDVKGKLIYTEQIEKVTSNLRKAVNLNTLAKGMYFVQLDNGTESITQKLIIQ